MRNNERPPRTRDRHLLRSPLRQSLLADRKANPRNLAMVGVTTTVPPMPHPPTCVNLVAPTHQTFRSPSPKPTPSRQWTGVDEEGISREPRSFFAGTRVVEVTAPLEPWDDILPARVPPPLMCSHPSLEASKNFPTPLVTETALPSPSHVVHPGILPLETLLDRKDTLPSSEILNPAPCST